jgi:glycosyltransferase involved in cell wall biosynthesis
VLEAMGQGRPIVCTGVGGVPDVVKGCGVVVDPGDTHALAMAVVMLLRNPALAWRLGRRGHQRLGRRFTEAACLQGYRELLGGLCATAPFAPASAPAPAPARRIGGVALASGKALS